MRLFSKRGLTFGTFGTAVAWACLLVAALCPPRQALAIGEVTGRIGGVVVIEGTKDGLAGVSLTIRSKELIGGSQATVTSDDGSYAFQALPPGTYELRANIEGFTPVLQRNIIVNAGQQSLVDIRLQIATTPQQNETYKIIEKTNPVLNRESAVSTTTIGAEKVEKTPIFHQVEGMTKLSPGVSDSNRPSVRGGLTRYTRFLVDGLDTTDIVAGGIGAPMNFESVEQFVISTGAMDAEYNAMGAVENMVTRSGGNKFTVDAQATIQPTEFSTANRYLPNSPQQDRSLLYDPSRKPERMFYSGAINVGGPIVKDRLWFFTSYEFRYSKQDATMPALPWHGINEIYYRPTDYYTHLARVKLTWQMTASTRLAVSYSLNRNIITNAANNAQSFIDPTTLSPEAERKILRSADWFVVLLDSLLTPKLLFQLQAGFTKNFALEDSACAGRTAAGCSDSGDLDHLSPAHILTIPNTIGGLPNPNSIYNNYVYNNSHKDWLIEDKWRVQFDPTLLYTAHWLGTHNIKGGLQFAYMSYSLNQGTPGGYRYTDNYVTDPGSALITPCNPGDPRTFAACNQRHVFNDSLPTQDGRPGPGLTTTSQAINIGVFLQDRWTIGRWLTIVPGMRFDVGLLYNNDGTNVANLYGYGPRLSVTYDLLHDHSTLVVAHYGRHNDMGNAFIANRSNPSPIDVLQVWNPATKQFEMRSQSGGASGQLFSSNVTPPKRDEVTVGIHREVFEQTVVGVDYVYDKYSNLWVNQEVNRIWDPSGTRVVGYADKGKQGQAVFQAATPDDAQRTYHGLDLWVNGSPGRWDIIASYTLAFNDGTTSDYFTDYRGNPRLIPLFNGPMADNHKHTLKGAINYSFAFGLKLGTRIQYLSGSPQWKTFRSPEDPTLTLYHSPRGSDTGTKINDPTTWSTFSAPDKVILDIQAQYSLEKLTRQRVELMVQLYNVFNYSTPTSLSTADGGNFGLVTGRLDNLLCEVLVRYRY